MLFLLFLSFIALTLT